MSPHCALAYAHQKITNATFACPSSFLRVMTGERRTSGDVTSSRAISESGAPYSFECRCDGSNSPVSPPAGPVMQILRLRGLTVPSFQPSAWPLPGHDKHVSFPSSALAGRPLNSTRVQSIWPGRRPRRSSRWLDERRPRMVSTPLSFSHGPASRPAWHVLMLNLPPFQSQAIRLSPPGEPSPHLASAPGLSPSFDHPVSISPKLNRVNT